jgi:tubulin polyglutamylase TTLL7
MKIRILIILVIILIVIIILFNNNGISISISNNKQNDTFTNNTFEINKNLHDFQAILKCLVDEKNSSNSIFLLNNKYYGLPCIYLRDDTFYTVIKELGFIQTSNIFEAGLIVPCTYEETEKEIINLQNNNIKNNKFGDDVRVFMLNNTDFMVSKWHLWEFLSNKYGEEFAGTLVPKSWNLSIDELYKKFVDSYDKNKLYITKNNQQRQEGLEIVDDINKIDRKKYVLIQELLQNPYLINGRKINLRIYCVVIRNKNNIKCYSYNDGFMYYTPEPFIKGSNDFKRNITTGYIDRKVYEVNPLTHKDFKKYLDSDRPLTDIEKYIRSTNVSLSLYVFNKINDLLRNVLDVFVEKLGNVKLGNSFQLYGIDVAIDNKLNAMMMEINKGPDISVKDERDGAVKKQLIKDMLKITGLIIYDNTNIPDFTLFLNKNI